MDSKGNQVFIRLAKSVPVISEISNSNLQKREMAERFGVSKRTIHRRVRVLQDMGVVRRDSTGYYLTSYGKSIAKYLVSCNNRVISLNRNSQKIQEISGNVSDPLLTESQQNISFPSSTEQLTNTIIEIIQSNGEHDIMISLPESTINNSNMLLESLQNSQKLFVFGQDLFNVLGTTWPNREIYKLSNNPISLDHGILQLIQTGHRIMIIYSSFGRPVGVLY